MVMIMGMNRHITAGMRDSFITERSTHNDRGDRNTRHDRGQYDRDTRRSDYRSRSRSEDRDVRDRNYGNVPRVTAQDEVARSEAEELI